MEYKDLFLDLKDFVNIYNSDGTRSGYMVSPDSTIIRQLDDMSFKIVNQNWGAGGREEGRKYVTIKIDNTHIRAQSCRFALIATNPFIEPYSYYDGLEVNHIDPSKPLNNHVSNLEWVTHKENMRHAAKSGLMQKVYPPELIRCICESICNGESRENTCKRLGIRKTLYDDIRAGRSHRWISEQYLDKGFKYSTWNREEKDAIAKGICEMLKKNINQRIIAEKYGVSIGLVSNIKCGVAYRHISKDYKFY